MATIMEYIAAAMSRAVYTWQPDTGQCQAHIPDLPGVTASGSDQVATEAALRAALEAWMRQTLWVGKILPPLDGSTVPFRLVIPPPEPTERDHEIAREIAAKPGRQ